MVPPLSPKKNLLSLMRFFRSEGMDSPLMAGKQAGRQAGRQKDTVNTRI
jgi:hypothetical protein